MANDRFLGMYFPFQEDLTGKYVRLTNETKDAVRSKLSNLITTMKGERVYNPEFGTNVMRFVFEPLDEITYGEIREEVIGAVTKYLKEVQINAIEANRDDNNLFIGMRVAYTISDGVFKEKDEVSLVF